VRYTANGTAVADFSLATSRGRQDAAGAWHDETEWHRVVCWERLATLVQEYLHKGSKVYVEGRIQSRKYLDRQNIERTAYKIVASDLTLLDRAPVEATPVGSPDACDLAPTQARSAPACTRYTASGEPVAAGASMSEEWDDDDVPF
jgi:single-strand DNA-binding protein